MSSALAGFLGKVNNLLRCLTWDDLGHVPGRPVQVSKWTAYYPCATCGDRWPWTRRCRPLAPSPDPRLPRPSPGEWAAWARKNLPPEEARVFEDARLDAANDHDH